MLSALFFFDFFRDFFYNLLMENLISSATQHGALGLVVLASFWYINKLSTTDENEKKDTIQILVDTNKILLDVVERNTRAFIELKEALKKN